MNRFKKINSAQLITLVSVYLLAVLQITPYYVLANGKWHEVAFSAIVFPAFLSAIFLPSVVMYLSSQFLSIKTSLRKMEAYKKKELINFLTSRKYITKNTLIHYAPADVLIRPILSTYYLINSYTTPVIAVLIIATWVLKTVMYPLYGTFVLELNIAHFCVLAMLIQVAVLATSNIIKALYALNKYKDLDEQTRFVSTNYTEEELIALVEKASLGKIIGLPKVDLALKEIIVTAYKTARKVNYVLLKHPQYSDRLADHSCSLEFILNSFIQVKTIPTIRLSEEHPDKPRKVKELLSQRLGTDLRVQLVSMDKRILSADAELEKILKEVATNKEEQVTWRDVDTDEQSQDMMLTNYFPDYHKLTFDDAQNKVVANNIINETLPELIYARDGLKGEQAIKMDNQIEKVKQFVRSIASNTPESKQRALQRVEQESGSILSIEPQKPYMSEIDLLIGATDRYIESVDRTLPINQQ